MIKLFSSQHSIKEKKYEKIKFLSVSNSDFRKCYVFKTTQYFFGFLRIFLKKLGVGLDFVEFVGRPTDQKSEKPILGREIPILSLEGEMENYQSRDYSVDVFYSKNKIYLIVNFRKNKSNEVNSVIEDLVSWGD